MSRVATAESEPILRQHSPDGRGWWRPSLAALVVLAALMPVGLAARPTSLRIRSVTVTREAIWHADPNGQQTPASCAGFRLSDQAALRWFNQAREVAQHEWLHELDWTQCSAEGTLRTSDGRTLTWELDQAGRARIIVSPTVSVFLGGPELPMRRRR